MCEAQVWHVLIIGLVLFFAYSFGKHQAKKEFKQAAIDISAALSRASVALDAVEEELLNTNFACSLFKAAAEKRWQDNILAEAPEAWNPNECVCYPDEKDAGKRQCHECPR